MHFFSRSYHFYNRARCVIPDTNRIGGKIVVLTFAGKPVTILDKQTSQRMHLEQWSLDTPQI